MLFKIHIALLIILLPISVFFAPFAAFLYDDPAAGGFLLILFSIIWFSMPLLIAAPLIAGLILAKLKKSPYALDR